MDPIALFVFTILLALILIAIIVPQIQIRKQSE
jgi:hypothetical protein